MGYSQCLFLSLLLAKFGTTAILPVASTNVVKSGTSSSVKLPGMLPKGADAAVLINREIFAPTNTSHDNLIRFNDTVHDAVITTILQYPKAVFILVQATAKHGPTRDPEEIQDVRLIFDLNGKSLYVEMREWGQWGAPRLTQTRTPPGNGPLPLHIAMDLPQADLLIKNAGYNQPYDAVDVRWPIAIPHARQQVYYLFGMIGAQPFTVAVGTRDSIVRANPAEDPAVNVTDGWLRQMETSSS
ncbi:hypothetical protein N7G274_006826 [Stereocaulon virgatum]|uniref:Uncharacterized protein n=1 Tax=Stereocaulon virgatum TaxID=373712 RepID=A0ABR4A5P4_9LECA